MHAVLTHLLLNGADAGADGDDAEESMFLARGFALV
jgi:hypothetical protein